MAALVVREDAALLLRQSLLLLQAGDDPVDRVLEIRLRDVLRLAAAGEDRGLVGDVREIGAGEAGGVARDHAQIDGACLRASSKSLRMRAAPRPANISTKAEALCE